MQSDQIQHLFTEYFVERGHHAMASSSLVPPADDPTVLLTTAGMQQMTPFFLGLATPPAPRLTTTQKCFRTVDIDEVGDESHCTFFEMLGNFSVGDYYKQGAMEFAWDLLTRGYGIDPQRLVVTIYPGEEETRQLWINAIGLEPNRIFLDPGCTWGPVGDSGPMGLNSEIYVDLGAHLGPDCFEGGADPTDSPRYLEVWNLVFMGLYQEKDGTRRDLENKNIDTGMGLERITMVLQGKDSIYDTDLYMPIIERAAGIAGVTYRASTETDRSLRVIADHGRAISFLIADGVLPGNEGRGYVLRRILRRAVRHGRLLGIERPFLGEIVETVVARFGGRYPELTQRQGTIARIVQHEEEAFGRTLSAGITRFEGLAGQLQAAGSTTVPGGEAFRLYHTYGFPFELTAELARDAGLEMDRDGFDAALEEARALSRASVAAFTDTGRNRAALYNSVPGLHSTFVGYETGVSDATTVSALFGADATVETIDAGTTADLVLNETPFYAESGGQVGDTGEIRTESGVFRVDDTQRPLPNVIVHRGEVIDGYISVGQGAIATIDAERRAAIQRNHTATHVLHRALRIVLGDETHQAGSLVAPDRLRFDFTAREPLGAAGLQRVQQIANSATLANTAVTTKQMAYDDAVARGAMALFGEKYGDVVRVVEIAGFSAELCGGTHVERTGDVGPVVVLHEASVGSGVRRIEALSGVAAVAHLLQADQVTREVARALHAEPQQVAEQVGRLQQELRERERDIDNLRVQLAASNLDTLLDNAQEVAGTRVVAARVAAPSREAMLQIGDRLRDKLQSGVIVLASEIDGQAALLATATKDQVARGAHAGKLIQATAAVIGGRGGGRPETAQGGGTDLARLDEALAQVPNVVNEQLTSAG